MRKWKASLAAVFCLLFLVSCAGTLPQPGTPSPVVSAAETKAVTYEGVALALNAAKGYIKGQELSGALKGEKLDAVVKKFNEAQKAFVDAGDSLILSLGQTNQEARAKSILKYNELLQKAAQMAGEIQGGK